MPTFVRVSLTLLAASLIAGCITTPERPVAAARLEGRSDSPVRGIVSFTPQQDGSLKVFVDATGLLPGEHGFHIHEVGDCRARDAASAGDIMSAGTMQNVLADIYGTVHTRFNVTGLSVTGENSIIGRSVLLHEEPSYYKPKPGGAPSKRIACGVISPL